jgi:hypothetical protein
MDEPREFVIPVQRRWTLWILPTLAILYFLAVLALAVLRVEIRGLPTEYLVLGGVVLFVVIMLIELPFLFRRRIRPAEPEPVPESDWQGEPAEPRMAFDDEKLVTNETQQGLRVLEYSSPAKSRHRGAVYAKTYVPVAKEWVLRIENLAADTHEL